MVENRIHRVAFEASVLRDTHARLSLAYFALACSRLTVALLCKKLKYFKLRQRERSKRNESVNKRLFWILPTRLTKLTHLNARFFWPQFDTYKFRQSQKWVLNRILLSFSMLYIRYWSIMTEKKPISRVFIMSVQKIITRGFSTNI